jgi:probable rRNA maturation factor
MQTIHITKHYQGIEMSIPRLKRLVQTVCDQFDLTDVEVGIAVVDDAYMVELNDRFFHKQGTTDCFSFDLSDEADARKPRYFEIVVNGPMAVHQARARGHTPEAELALYITHGLLHQLGFDDQTRSSARQMHRIEDEILHRFGYGIVYNNRHT